MAEETRAALVQDRLEFVRIISSLNDAFLDPKKVRLTPQGGWTHPWKYFDSLRNYLLLTCFDLLGQPSSFKDFSAWLTASSTAGERSVILENASGKATLLETVSYVHEQYIAKYGAKRAFYRFVQEVLPKPMAEKLMYSIAIRKIDTERNKEIEKVESEDKKLAFLYDVRNSFTHKAINTGSPGGGVFPNWGKPVLIDGVPMQGWEPVRRDMRNGHHFEFSVRDWPSVLIQAVEIGVTGVTD